MLHLASRSAWAACAALLLITSPAVAQTTALLEDFEDATVAYTTSPAASEFNDGDRDFFTRTNGSDISGAYSVSGFNGSFYFAAQDVDGDGQDKVQNLVFSGIDVAGLSTLQFTALFAEDDDGSNEDWDDTSSDDNYVRVYALVDGATEQLIFAIEGSNPGGTNGAPRVDDDLNGVGEGTEITDTFASFSAAIAGAGSTLTLRIEMNLEDGDEDIAIDDVRITGDALAAPVACTTASPLYISSFAVGSPGGVTVSNSSATDTIDLPGCTLAVFDGISELVTNVETTSAPLAPAASYPYTPDLPAGPGAVIVSTAGLSTGEGVSDAAGTLVAAVVYDAAGAVYGECGWGPVGAEGGALNPCDSEVGAASVSAALAALFGGAVASETGSDLDLAMTVAPNPVARQATISYTLTAATDVRVSLVDALGREVTVLVEGARGPGRHEAVLQTAAYPAGVYVVRMIARDELRTVPITVVR